MKSKREREEACPVCQHYHDWEGGETCTVCGHTSKSTDQLAKEGALPCEIIPGTLYLGSHDHASRISLLKALGVTHILNTVPSCPVLFQYSFTYHTISGLPVNFQECFAFLDQAMEAKARTLVYCMTGISRSNMVAVGYMMKLRRWRLAESYQWVKQRRPKMQLNAEGAQRLQELEVQLLGSSSTGYSSQSSQPSSSPAAPAWLSWQEMALAQQAQQPPAATMQSQGAVQLGFAQHPSSGGFVFGAG